MGAMTEKVIRDPVHDVIAFRLEEPGDALLFRLINAVEFQRLRRIRQLGMTALAYPGADHSRYSHSLGVMETARKILGQIGRSQKLDEETSTVCLAAALLHDLGHGPLSHVFERISEIRHELLTQRIILDPESHVHRILIEHEKTLPERIVSFLRCDKGRSFYCDVLESQLDADRMDYLLRDNLMTGSQYGGYDLNWLLHALTVDSGSGRLAVTSKGVSAAEAFLQSRYHMYRNVYFHKVVRSAEGMMKLALQRARRLAVQGRLKGPDLEDCVCKALLGRRLTAAEFTDLDDVSVLHCLKLWTTAEDVPLARLCGGLLNRRLFKTIDLISLDAAGAAAAVETARAVVTAKGGDADYDLFFDEPVETPYETYSAENPAAAEILVVDDSGSARTLAELSPLVGAMNRQLMFRRLHVTGEMKSAVAAALKR
jgi:HD superfamily phosphohydrolase